jgi:general secretion pathway protein H
MNLSQRNLTKSIRGFILLELIIVLFLITVIIGISAAFFANNLPSYKFNAAVRDISATVKQARALARIHNERQFIAINLDSKTYTLEGHGTKDIPPDVSVKVTDPVSGDVHEGEYHFIIYPTGAVEGGTIVLWNSKRSASIQIDPVVGTVVIK